jgi:NAD(P) transhydrogenase subunit alpha
MLSIVVVSLIVFVLACFIGYFVVWGVTPALHTPLMAVTNAISGIVVVAAMTVAAIDVDYAAVMANLSSGKIMGNSAYSLIEAAPWFGFVAVILASINIFGGFAITHRMLSMFKKKQPKKESK